MMPDIEYYIENIEMYLRAGNLRAAAGRWERDHTQPGIITSGINVIIIVINIVIIATDALTLCVCRSLL